VIDSQPPARSDPTTDLNAAIFYEIEEQGFDPRMVLDAIRVMAKSGVRFEFPDRYKMKEQHDG
jgi:hypothetical protein